MDPAQQTAAFPMRLRGDALNIALAMTHHQMTHGNESYGHQVDPFTVLLTTLA